MILSNDEILIKTEQSANQCPRWIMDQRAYNVELEALINGKNFSDLLYQIEHKEDADKLTARKKYSHSIKDMFERVMRPLDNIYAATGGSKVYEVEDESSAIIKKISQIRDGKSLEKWLQRNWMKLYHTDPNGVIFYENKKEKFYPTYKNIHSIRNYESDGQNLEWILFEGNKKTNGIIEWRFVDAEKDVIIIQDNTGFKIDEEKVQPHPFKECPGIVISDIIEIGTEQRKSPIHAVIELAKEYLRDQSIKTLFKFLHGIPIFWRYAVQCRKCSGTGKLGNEICTECNGQGFYAKKDITDCVTLPVPDDKDQPIVAPNIAGFITPPLDIWKQYTEELQLLEDIIYMTIWGTINYSRLDKNIQTATEIIYDTAPQINRLNDYADVAEWVEWRLSDLAINFMYQSLREDEDKVCILYGRNYIIEPVNVLLDRYQTSREKGVNTAILDKELEEWICAKYKNDVETMEDEIKRLKVEPFIHYTAEEVKNNFGENEAKEKMLFAEWWRGVADKEMDTEEMKLAFKEWCNGKINTQYQTPQALNRIGKRKTENGEVEYFDKTSNEVITDPNAIKEYEDATIETTTAAQKTAAHRIMQDIDIIGQNNLGETRTGNF